MTPQTLENSMTLFSFFRSLILWIHFIYNIIYLWIVCVLCVSNRTACSIYIVQHCTWYEVELIVLWFCYFFLVGWSFSLSVDPYYLSFGVGVFFLKIDVEYLQYFPIMLPLGLFKHRLYAVCRHSTESEILTTTMFTYIINV